MSLPPVTIFVGPDPDTAWQAALDCTRREGDGDPPRHAMLVAPGDLTAAVAREIVRVSVLKPLSGYSVVCLSLDGCVEAVQHSLLKTLEEPPPGIRFVLSAATPLPTVMSRAVVRRVGVPEGLPDWQEELKPAICMAVAAAGSGDARRLARLTRDWSHKHVVLLSIWAVEGFTERFHVFARADRQGYGPAALWSAMDAIDRYSGARPRVAAQAALLSLTQKER